MSLSGHKGEKSPCTSRTAAAVDAWAKKAQAILPERDDARCPSVQRRRASQGKEQGEDGRTLKTRKKKKLSGCFETVDSKTLMTESNLLVDFSSL